MELCLTLPKPLDWSPEIWITVCASSPGQSPEWKVKPADSETSAFVKIVFGSDNGLDGIESVVKQYHAMFDACAVPAHTRKMIMGGTLAKMLRLPDGH